MVRKTGNARRHRNELRLGSPLSLWRSSGNRKSVADGFLSSCYSECSILFRLDRVPVSVQLPKEQKPTSWQDVGQRDLADFGTIDHHVQDMGRHENLQRLVTGRAGVRIDLDLAVDQIDDPVDRDAGLAIDLGLMVTVIAEAGVGDLDHQGDIRLGRGDGSNNPHAALDQHTGPVRARWPSWLGSRIGLATRTYQPSGITSQPIAAQGHRPSRAAAFESSWRPGTR